MNKSRIPLSLLFSIILVTQAFSQSEKAFTKKLELTLPDNHLIGAIEWLDVLGDSYLITDFQQQVFLFKEGTDNLKKLDPRECFPGFKFQPIHTFHLADSSLFLFNAGLPGYRFKSNGDCLGSVKKGFIPVPKQHIALGKNDDFFTIQLQPNEEVILNQYDKNGTRINKYEIKETIFPEFNFRFLGGGLVLHDGIIYYMLTSGEALHRFDIDNERQLDAIEFSPSYASVMRKDISKDPFSGRMIKEIDKIVTEHYVVHSIFKLSDRFLLIQTSFRENDERRYGLHFLDLRTQEIGEAIIEKQPFIFARDNKAYRINDQREENTGILNPGITIYKLINE
jgi:hypothetical protein